MRVYFYLADITFTGGIEKITTTLANYFVNNGIEVTIVSNFHTNKNFSYELDNRVKTDFLSNIPYNGKPGSFIRLKKFFKNRKLVKAYFSKLHNETIIVQSFPNAFLYFLAMKKKNENKIINVEHVHYFYYNKLLRILRYFVYRKYNNVCVLTNADKKQYDKLKIHASCIPNAIDFSVFLKIGINAKRRNTIVGVGRLEKQKNFSSLIRVFYKAHQKHPDWTLEIYGKGNLHDELESQIKDLEISEDAKLMGVSNEINKVFQESGIFVLSSLYEGFPMVIVEAMASGCPVVSFDCPNGPSDLIENKKNGLLVENQNEEKLYESILQMIENPDFRKICAANALKSVKKYSIENIFEDWKSLFNLVQEKK